MTLWKQVCAIAIGSLIVFGCGPDGDIREKFAVKNAKSVTITVAGIGIAQAYKLPYPAEVLLEEEDDIKSVLNYFVGLDGSRRPDGPAGYDPTLVVTIKYTSGDARIIESEFDMWRPGTERVDPLVKPGDYPIGEGFEKHVRSLFSRQKKADVDNDG